MPLTAIGFWLLYVSGVGAALLAPLAGVLLYILIYHMNPGYQWWGESVRAVGLRTSLTVVVATVIGLVLRYPRYRGIARQFPMPVIWALGLVLLALASMTWGYGPSERGAFMAEKIVKVMIFVPILIRCVREPQHYQLVIVAWLCGIFYIGYQACGGVGIYYNERLTAGLGGPDFGESSGLAVHLVSTLPLIGAMFFMARRWWTRGVILIIGALSVNTIIMTRTRNAIAGLVVMSAVAVLSLPRGYRWKGWAAIAVGGLLAFQLADPGWRKRVSTITRYDQDASAAKRLQYWRVAAEMAGDYPLGIGLGNFHQAVKEYVPGLRVARSAHSTYFECLAEFGYPGLILLALVVAVALRRLNRIRREASQIESDFPIRVGRWEMRFHLGWHAMALRAGLCGYLACGLFTTRLWTEDFWILIGLACCLVNVADRIRKRSSVLGKSDAVSGEPISAPVGNEDIQPALPGNML
ncbi:MAG: O-antigen ligase family protein [Phycisphaerae bacterium]